MKGSDQDKESVKQDNVEEAKKTENTSSAKPDKMDQAKKVGEDVLVTSKEVWSKLKPKLKTACEKVGKEASYQINNENSVTRRVSEKAYQSAKSTVNFAKQKIKEKQAAKKNAAPEQKQPVKENEKKEETKKEETKKEE